MKSVFLSVVIITALAVAGIGGTLAGWSDTEESQDNYIVTGALDLKVNDTDDKPWGIGIDGLIELYDIVPSDTHKVVITVANEGQAIDPLNQSKSAPLFIYFKDFACSNVTPEHDGYEWPASSGLIKPEPELVAEYGGVLAQTHIIGDGTYSFAAVTDGVWGSTHTDWHDADWPKVQAMGKTGDTACSLSGRIEVTIYFGEANNGEQIVWGPVMLTSLLNEQIYLGELPESGADYEIGLWFHMLNTPDDENWDEERWPEKFADWQTNAWMKDKINFNIMFELLDYNTTLRPT